MTTEAVRLAVVAGHRRTEAAVVRPDGHPIAAVEFASTGSAVADVDAALTQLLDRHPAETAAARAVVVACGWSAAALHRLHDLNPVLAVRLAATPRSAVPPLNGWPSALRTAVSAGEVVVSGGCGVDGSAPVPLDRAGLRAALARLGPSASAVAVTGTFAGVSPDDERAAERIAETELPGRPVVLSHDFGVLGLLERENAAILNAALTGVGRAVTDALVAALAEHGLTAPCYVVRNDGTLMLAEHAARFPVLTYAGPEAAWLRGGAVLAGLDDALVCRAEHTEVTIGVAHAGRPRVAPGRRMLAGVPTTVGLPHLATVRRTARGADAVRAGSRSHLSRTIERMRDGGAPEQVVLVGAAGELPGVAEVLRPRQARFAAAVGAALAPVGATAETILPRSMPADRRCDLLVERAVELAVRHGADLDAISVAELTELPLPYLPDSPVRARARVEGPPQLRARPS
ncbi:hypothetical protein BAY59_34845 [Prauserella coralliicola]|nr:hypothetical protein BAY59_34845 [Prauserella coralliicola]